MSGIAGLDFFVESKLLLGQDIFFRRTFLSAWTSGGVAVQPFGRCDAPLLFSVLWVREVGPSRSHLLYPTFKF